jgi:hypothetical protein
MGSKSTGLRPQGLESPRRRLVPNCSAVVSAVAAASAAHSSLNSAIPDAPFARRQTSNPKSAGSSPAGGVPREPKLSLGGLPPWLPRLLAWPDRSGASLSRRRSRIRAPPGAFWGRRVRSSRSSRRPAGPVDFKPIAAAARPRCLQHFSWTLASHPLRGSRVFAAGQNLARLEPAILGSEDQRFIHLAAGTLKRPIVLSLWGQARGPPNCPGLGLLVSGRLRQGVVARGFDARASARSAAASREPPTLATRV